MQTSRFRPSRWKTGRKRRQRRFSHKLKERPHFDPLINPVLCVSLNSYRMTMMDIGSASSNSVFLNCDYSCSTNLVTLNATCPSRVLGVFSQLLRPVVERFDEVAQYGLYDGKYGSFIFIRPRQIQLSWASRRFRHNRVFGRSNPIRSTRRCRLPPSFILVSSSVFSWSSPSPGRLWIWLFWRWRRWRSLGHFRSPL